YNHWSLDFLVDYIVYNHHQYLRDSLPKIGFYAKTVENIHSDAHSELVRIHVEFLKLSNEMQAHMNQEEDQLFPFIKKLVPGKENPDWDEEMDSPKMIDMMQHEHKEVGDTLATIRELSKDYQPPADACTTYR